MPKSLNELAHWAFSFILGFVAGLVLCQCQSFRFIPQISLGQALQTGPTRCGDLPKWCAASET